MFWIIQLSRLMTKPIKWHVRKAKTQIRLGIRPVWSESSLCTWRKLGSLATNWEHSGDWSDWADAQADLSLRWAHSHFVGFVMRRIIWVSLYILIEHFSGNIVVRPFIVCWSNMRHATWKPVFRGFQQGKTQTGHSQSQKLGRGLQFLT